MKTINISSKQYRCSVLCILRVAGYKDKNANELILEDENGRFHAKIVGGRAYIHYDLIVGYKHKVFSMPIKLKAEKDRIMNGVAEYKLQASLKPNKSWIEYHHQKRREFKHLKKTGIISPISPFKKFI